MDTYYFVRAQRNDTLVRIPCPGVRSTQLTIGSIHKELQYKSPADEARAVRNNLIQHGWKADVIDEKGRVLHG